MNINPQHKSFSERLLNACDSNNKIPALNFGRNTWIVDELEARYGAKVTTETVRKWFGSVTKPREATMKQLANILDVEVTWLSLGTRAELDRETVKFRDASLDGSVNLLAGIIRMSGGRPAFPTIENTSVDMTAVIKGVNYSFHVCRNVSPDSNALYEVPISSDGVINLAVVQTDNFQFEFYELDSENSEVLGIVSKGALSVGEKDVRGGAFKKIETFSERL